MTIPKEDADKFIKAMADLNQTMREIDAHNPECVFAVVRGHVVLAPSRKELAKMLDAGSKEVIVEEIKAMVIAT